MVGKRKYGAGLTTWQSRHDLVRSRSRARSIVAGLSALAALWLPAFFNAKGNSVLGGAILEVFTGVPLIVTALRAHGLTRLIKRVDTMAEDDQRAEADALRYGDEMVWRLTHLVASMDDGAAKAAGENAVRTAEHAVRARRPIVTRRNQLDHLAATSRTSRNRATFASAIEVCDAELNRLDEELDDLAASVTKLVDAASEDVVQREIMRVQEAEERVSALTAGFEEVDRVLNVQRGEPDMPDRQVQAQR